MTQIRIIGLLLIAIGFSCTSTRAPAHDPARDPARTQRMEHGHGHHGHGAGTRAIDGETYGDQLGTVQFPVSCNEAASEHAERGLALLHHMTYDGAQAAFAAAAEADPNCAMSYWGQAMAIIHPLWSDPPSQANFERGTSLIYQAQARGPKSARENAYIAAVEAYYAQGRGPGEMPNLTAFEKGWRRVHEQFPQDPEAAAFYALAHMATADPEDKTYAKQKRAAEIAKQVLTQIPDHPGAHHYIIHAYDYPPLAENALEVARSYAEIAPAVPHALHMPSHIFIRVGQWPEAIEMNQRSAAAALEHPADGKLSMHYLHAQDYLAYAYLQRGEYANAQEIVAQVQGLDVPIQAHIGSAYSLAAVPARFALERQAWAEAAALEPRIPRQFAWEDFPTMEAITHFAKALGAARSGNPQMARAAIDNLATLRDRAGADMAYWANQVDIQRLSALAWLAYEEGARDEALQSMQRAARMEAATEKHPISPGEILPAGELLADMLLAMGRHREAHAQYVAALERTPNRFNSLYGAGRAAELAGNNRQATHFYTRLVEVAAPTARRDRLEHATGYLSQPRMTHR
jgi:tetratricopeptide (TPR) repeat protein